MRMWTGRDLNPRLPDCESGVHTKLNYRPSSYGACPFGFGGFWVFCFVLWFVVFEDAEFGYFVFCVSAFEDDFVFA